jgi:Holliday junction resolvasome RuvABC endonuclease subunit
MNARHGVHVLGCDPGFASFGYSVIELLPTSERVVLVGVIRTTKSEKKANLLAADDNLDRLQAIAIMINDLLATYSPVAITAESFSPPRNSSAASKVALAWGSLGTQAALGSIPLLQVSPQQLKKCVVNNKSASKEDIQTEVTRLYPELVGLLSGIPKTQQEHACDALASTVACLRSGGNGVLAMARRLA